MKQLDERPGTVVDPWLLSSSAQSLDSFHRMGSEAKFWCGKVCCAWSIKRHSRRSSQLCFGHWRPTGVTKA